MRKDTVVATLRVRVGELLPNMTSRRNTKRTLSGEICVPIDAVAGMLGSAKGDTAASEVVAIATEQQQYQERSDHQSYDPIDLFGLDHLTIVVTGAAGQIGAEIVNACLASGAHLVAVDSDFGVLEQRAADSDWPTDRVLLLRCDIRRKDEVAATFKRAGKAFGSIDALVNNAGVSVFEPFQERTEEAFDWVMDVNLKGTFWCIQQFVKHRAQVGGAGRIVNIASHYGLISPDPRIYTDRDRRNSEVYGATKAGIIQMTRYFAVNAAHVGIRVNAVAPGGVRNPREPQGLDFQHRYAFRCPMGRMAELHEIAGTVVFLLSPAASYINGHTVVVDGGMTAW